VTLAATIIALPTNATAASCFDYSAVAPEIACGLRQQAARIRQRIADDEGAPVGGRKAEAAA
jgi:hypothetical protein